MIGLPNYQEMGLSPLTNPNAPLDVSTFVVKTKGGFLFEDSLATCTFCTQGGVKILSELVSAATGWDFTIDEALTVGLRTANLLRVFNLKQGIAGDLDKPSPRYGSTPVDGPRKGTGIGSVWGEMIRNYYRLLGWDEETGKPLPETLKKLGLERAIPELW